MKYLNIKDSLEKMQMKPATNGKKKREETEGEGDTIVKCQNIKKEEFKTLQKVCKK